MLRYFTSGPGNALQLNWSGFCAYLEECPASVHASHNIANLPNNRITVKSMPIAITTMQLSDLSSLSVHLFQYTDNLSVYQVEAASSIFWNRQ